MTASRGLKVAVLAMLGVPAMAQPLATVRVTQRYLEPLCLDGAPVPPGERNWRLGAGTHTLAFAMRNDPQEGVEPHQEVDADGSSGVAEVAFTVEDGHEYEVEVRSSVMSFATRVWEPGGWKPVVRDRTADRLISSEPEWRATGCLL